MSIIFKKKKKMENGGNKDRVRRLEKQKGQLSMGVERNL